MKQVLVAYDGSAPAQRALAHAADLARPGDTVTVVNVLAAAQVPRLGFRVSETAGATAGVAAAVASERWRMPVRA